MMTTRLPRPIAAYIAAVNLQDIDAVTASFSEGAVVHDEGQTRRGIGAIRKWADGYHALRVRRRPGHGRLVQ